MLFIWSYFHTQATLARMEAKSGSGSAAAAPDSKTDAAAASGKEADVGGGGGKDDYDDAKEADYDEKQDKFIGKWAFNFHFQHRPLKIG